MPQAPAATPAPAEPEDHSRAPEGAMLLEFAWEVCNQVGGIYQVLRSKAPALVERWGDRYCLVGPYVEPRAALEFEPTPATGPLAQVIAELRDEGLTIHHGRWLIPGSPRVLLLEHWSQQHKLGDLKYRLWEKHGVESPADDWLFNDAITFGESIRRLLERLSGHWQTPAAAPSNKKSDGKGAGGPAAPPAKRSLIAHFHEWLGSLALPMLREQRLPIATLFTTHATLLGRYIASTEERFYDILPWLDGETEAARYNIRAQFRAEKTCAHAAHVFTTVSSVTAEECTQLLARQPDLVTPNGLNIRQYYLTHEMQFRHAEFKDRIHEFSMGHFFPSYSFDLDKTLYFFTSGRFEPRNKGFDLALEAMARLNAELKSANLGITVVFFIISHRPTKTINPLALEKRAVLAELRQVCQRIMDDLSPKLFRKAASGERIHLDDQVDDYWKLRHKRTQYAFRWAGLPMVVTHLLQDDQTDPVLNYIRQLGLINRAEDPVKVVYHPEFISPVSPLWGMEYEQFVRGCHLGVFPSLYEPWGYTPLECMALGVPAVTSDLAGFGRWATEHIMGHEELGLLLLRRRGRTYHDAAADLTQKLLDFCKLRRRDRVALRNTVERTAWEFDWGRLAIEYHRAHDLALQRMAAESQ
ncbi:MAG: glycosyltransferase [Phycisphaerales bacterium]